MVNKRKCAVIGCGFVGSSTAFALMESGLFNEMVLLDVNHKKAEGEAMDISHGLPFAGPMEIYAGDYCDLEDVGIIVIAAGAGQKPGETRLDLVHKNVEIFKNMIPQITKYNQEGILLVISNPVDILTWVTLKLSGFPSNRVIGSGTVLDSARFKYLIGKKLGVDPRSVHAYIIGEHGDSELAVWSSANISGVPLTVYGELKGLTDHEKEQAALAGEVKNSAYEIIACKGATYYGIALSVRRICECIVKDEHSVLPISSLIQGHFGLENICMGVPAVLGGYGVEQVIDIKISEKEKQELLKSAGALKKVLDEIDLG